MSQRNDEDNTNGTVTVSGGNMPAGIHTNKHNVLSRTTGKVAAHVVIANGHAVEVDGDGGVWDTVSNKAVDISQTTIGTINN